jgi:class 3 adenylate cyclase
LTHPCISFWATTTTTINKTKYKTINQYFDRIINLIDAYGGDIIKFAGDALIVEWKETKTGPQRLSSWEAVLKAATCASRIVDSCCDVPVCSNNNSSSNNDNILISTLNVHVGLGYGHVMACSVGNLQRREFLILGETIQQVAQAMSHAQQGEVVASAEAYAILNETSFMVNPSLFDLYDDEGAHLPQIIARKKDQYFKPKVQPPLSSQCKNDNAMPPLVGTRMTDQQQQQQQSELWQRISGWSVPVLERLLARMSSYVHPAALTQEMDGNGKNSTLITHDAAATVAKTIASTKNHDHNLPMTAPAAAAAVVDDAAELREVFTTFIQPEVDIQQIMGPDVKLETVELLQRLMLIVNNEVTRFKGQLRQFIVDDKGLVIIANFGLRGSTFPNMVEERGLPCISNIKTLVKTELELNCRIGATFGKAYCGIVGAGIRHEYAVLGSPVNLAARLMATQENHGILVDEAVKMST